MSADNFTFAESTSEVKHDPVYTSKQWSYQVDQNNSSYSSKQVIFDLSGFYNSQRFINPQEMFVVFPVVSTMSAYSGGNENGGLGAGPHINFAADTGISSDICDNGGQITDQFAMGYKSGYWNLINSIQIQVDGKDVIQLTPNINYHASFVANTSWSDSDIKKHGSILGYLPDKSDSWKLINANCSTAMAGSAGAAVSKWGWGVTNNSLVPQPIFSNPYVASYPSEYGGVGRSNTFAAVSEFTEATCNSSFLERMKTTNFYNKSLFGLSGALALENIVGTSNANHQNADPAASSPLCIENVMISETLANLAAGVKTGIDSASGTAFRQLFTTCIVRFKDICNLFSNLPLTRGLYMRVIVNLNTGYVVIPTQGSLAAVGANAFAPAGTVPGYIPYGLSVNQTAVVKSAVSSVQYSNTFPGTCPLMLAPMETSACSYKTGAGGAGTYPDDANIQIWPGVAADVGTQARGDLIVSVAIATADPVHNTQPFAVTGTAPHPLKQCRIYAPIIDLEPSLVTSYLTQSKIQGIRYRDVLQFVYPGVAGGAQASNFTWQIANGIVNAKRLIIIPFYHGIASGSDGLVMFEPTSPFDSAPSTVAPQSGLTDFNVLISNMNVFQRNISYSFENFMEEMSLTNAINGGLDTGLTSGQISYKDWVNNYRYYVVDLSRRLAGDNTPKSLTIVGKNSSALTVDYYAFVEYERHLELDVESGHITVSSN